MSPICRGFALLICVCAFVLAACSARNVPSMVASPNDAAQSVLHASPYVRLMAETSSVNNFGAFTLGSPDFKNDGTLPSTVAGIAPPQCRGENLSPELDWSNAPVGTKSFALVLFDETASFGQWGVYNVRPSVNRLASGIKAGNIASSWMQVMDDAGIQGYFGPCPPPGVAHRYVFTIYALDTTLTLEDNDSPMPAPNVESLLGAMMGHVLGRSSITGLLQKT